MGWKENIAFMNKTESLKEEIHDLNAEISRLSVLPEGTVGMCAMTIDGLKKWLRRTQAEYRLHLGLE